MLKTVIRLLLQPLHRKGLERSTLIILIVLLVFLVVMFAILMMVSTKSTGEIESLCAKTDGLIGC